jgi:hypothetical protein
MNSFDIDHALKSCWWLQCVRPAPTWESMQGYHVSLGLLYSKPPSPDLEKKWVQAYLAGLLEGEGYFHYSRHNMAYFPCVYLRMCELPPVRFFSRVLNVAVTLLQRSYVSRVKGLRAVLLARVIGTMLSGKRRLTSELFIQRGYRVINPMTLQSYRLIYGSAKQVPSSLRLLVLSFVSLSFIGSLSHWIWGHRVWSPLKRWRFHMNPMRRSGRYSKISV